MNLFAVAAVLMAAAPVFAGAPSVRAAGEAVARAEFVRYDDGLQSFSARLAFSRTAKGDGTRIDVSAAAAAESCQTIRGYGFGLSESTVLNFRRLNENDRRFVLTKLFAPEDGANLTYVVLPLSSTDFSDSARGDFSVCDCGDRRIGPDGTCFDPSRLKDAIELLREARRINPAIRVSLKPWTTPPYMKTAESLATLTSGPYKGGDFDPKWTGSLARCLARSVEWVKAQGIPVQSLTVQNEPGLKLPYPSVFMDNASHARVLDEVHRLLRKKSPEVQLVLRSDNFNSVWDAKATFDLMKTKPKKMAFFGHCYSNDPQSSLELRPAGKKLFCEDEREFEYAMGECTASREPGDGDFGWWMSQRVIQDTDMGAGAIIAWNGLLDEKYGPTNFGCEGCRGLISADFSDAETRLRENPELKAIATIARRAQPGAKRLLVDVPAGDVQAVFLKNPDGSKVGVLWNESWEARPVHLKTGGGEGLSLTLPARAAATVTW